ncbi:phenylalanine--tRNA ligase subunit beta [Carnimonas bestiolae]|uniref:phenylalanine--tRNA ligase subunit beta n=1 Tax=Carnimonas bestiolae TaxID=3402172 RepID=UPI003EDCA382
MKFSEQWLRQWVAPELDAAGIAHRLTMAGLEVDAVEPIAPAFNNVVVGVIESAEQHPDADKLRVCQVNDGTDTWQIVCGAPNAAAGLKVAVARIGAILPGDFKIKKAKLRGVESKGMLCGASELGLEDEPSPGIMELPADAPLGADLREWLQLDGSIIDIDITPNRGDCFSIRGIARDLAAVLKLEVTAPRCAASDITSERVFPTKVALPEQCPRLLTRVVENVDLSQPTPVWMQEQLRCSGVRSIDLVVDITNYVMLELGQPLHGYDLERLEEFLEVRAAQQGETLQTLDGQQQQLTAGTLIIADAKGPLGIAGVMGGEHSGVSASTRTVLLEAAFFTPLALAGTARRYGLHTDASQRFERGVDHQLQQAAIERATQLLTELGGGSAGPLSEVVSSTHLPAVTSIEFKASEVERLLGVELPASYIADVLARLGFSLRENGAECWTVDVPSWRFDVSQAADLVEEIARVYGYTELPSREPRISVAPRASREAQLGVATLQQELVSRGYQEAITYSFVAPELQQQVLPDKHAPQLSNPLSVEMSVMRAGLWPGLIKAQLHNLNRQQSRVRLFEVGLTFEGERAEHVDQIERIGGIVCGSRLPEGWNASREGVDFFDVKGDVEALLALGNAQAEWRFEPAEHPALHPGQSARIVRVNGSDESVVGWLGALHPALRAKLGIKVDTFVFELDVEPLCRGQLPHFQHLSRYPEVRRDLALVVEESQPVAELLDQLRSSAGEWLTDVHLFDVYQGKGVAEGHKSVALGLTWQHPSRTLNDSEIEQWVADAVDSASQHCGATLRG